MIEPGSIVGESLQCLPAAVAIAKGDESRAVLPGMVGLWKPCADLSCRPFSRLVCVTGGAGIGRPGRFRLQRIGPSEEMVAALVDPHIGAIRHMAAYALCRFGALLVMVV